VFSFERESEAMLCPHGIGLVCLCGSINGGLADLQQRNIQYGNSREI